MGALRSLEAILLLATDTSEESRLERERITPHDEMKTRFKIAQLLFEYCRNIPEAEKHLQKAVGWIDDSSCSMGLSVFV
jgi:hypothetical protein